MPLYEFILIARPSPAKSTSILLQQVAQAATQHGAVVRTFQILGDRIMKKPIKAYNGSHYGIGRYIQLLVDCPPSLIPKLHVYMFRSLDSLRVHTHRMKDFYQETQYSKQLNDDLDVEKKIKFDVDEVSEVDNLVDALNRRQNLNRL
jgi:ribosomal protein S6